MDSTTAELLVENLAVLNRTHVIVFVTLRDPGLQSLLDGRARGDLLRKPGRCCRIRRRRDAGGEGYSRCEGGNWS